MDALETSDNYLVGLSKKARLFEISFIEKKNLSEKICFFLSTDSGKIYVETL